MCADDCEREYITALVPQYLQIAKFGKGTEVLTRADRTVIFFNRTGSQVTIRS